MEQQKRPNIKDYIFLHGILFLYSMGSLYSKAAAQQSFLSAKFCVFYGLMLLNLMIYAILWQQVLKRFSLTTAFANKAVVILWGMIWGATVFQEKIKFNMIIGAAIIIVGVLMVVKSDE